MLKKENFGLKRYTTNKIEKKETDTNHISCMHEGITSMFSFLQTMPTHFMSSNINFTRIHW